MRFRGIAKHLATRRVRTGTTLTAMLLAMGAVAWDASPPASLVGAPEKKAANKVLQKAVRATRAQVTGEFSIQPVGVEGSYDQAAGTMKVDSDYFDPDKDADFVSRRIVIDGSVYYKDDYSHGDECWEDLTGFTYDGFGDEGWEVALLVDSLKAESGAGHTIEATVPVGRLSDAFFGSNPFEKRSPNADSPYSVRVPVTVRIGEEAVHAISVDVDAVFATLKGANVSAEDAFGDDADTDYLSDLGDVEILLTQYGLPVTIERPLPWDIGITEDEKC